MHRMAMVVGETRYIALWRHVDIPEDGLGLASVDPATYVWNTDDGGVARVSTQFQHEAGVRAIGPGRCKILANVVDVKSGLRRPVGIEITVTERPADEYVIEPEPRISRPAPNSR